MTQGHLAVMRAPAGSVVLSAVGAGRRIMASRTWYRLPASAINGAKPMAREDFVTVCTGFVTCTGGFGFGWFITPEPAEMKLARIRASLDLSMPIQTLPPEVKALRCMTVWVGGPGVSRSCGALPRRCCPRSKHRLPSRRPSGPPAAS
jgi:hypothetical protein